jgi:uncharacterized membrane protein YeaQ/YmgE (transglycosylase-associated protein family)
MHTLLSMLGIPDLPTAHVIIVVGLALTSALMMGWLADGILGGGGFGIFANGVLLLVGAIVGAIIWRKLGYSVGASPALATAIAAGAAGVTTLLLASTVRRALV